MDFDRDLVYGRFEFYLLDFFRGGGGTGETCVAGETTIAADGTHPDGMHSCLPLK